MHLEGREDEGILQHETQAAGAEDWCGTVVVGSLSFYSFVVEQLMDKCVLGYRQQSFGLTSCLSAVLIQDTEKSVLSCSEEGAEQ